MIIRGQGGMDREGWVRMKKKNGARQNCDFLVTMTTIVQNTIYSNKYKMMLVFAGNYNNFFLSGYNHRLKHVC